MASNDFYNKIICSIIGTSTAELVTIPICTVKTVYQTSDYKGPWLTAKDILKHRGLSGFYYGTAPAVICQIVSTSSKFAFYHSFKTYRETKDDDLFGNSINGVMGGIVGSFMSHPFDVVKNYRQRQAPFFSDLKSTGPSLLYRGYSQNFIKNVMLYSMLYPLYDYFRHNNLDPIKASACTSMTTTIILQPIDFLKVRMIANKPIWLGWDIRNYYRGFTLNLTRVVPHFAITMSVIEWLTNYIKV